MFRVAEWVTGISTFSLSLKKIAIVLIVRKRFPWNLFVPCVDIRAVLTSDVHLELWRTFQEFLITYLSSYKIDECSAWNWYFSDYLSCVYLLMTFLFYCPLHLNSFKPFSDYTNVNFTFLKNERFIVEYSLHLLEKSLRLIESPAHWRRRFFCLVY